MHYFFTDPKRKKASRLSLLPRKDLLEQVNWPIHQDVVIQKLPVLFDITCEIR